MVRRKTHQEYATFFIPSYTTFEHNSVTYGEEVIEELKQLHYTNKQFNVIELQELIDRYKKLNAFSAF